MKQRISPRPKTSSQIKMIQEVQHACEMAMAAVISYLQSTDHPTSEAAHELIDTILAEYDCESPEGHIMAGGSQAVEPHEKGTGALSKGAPIVIDIYPRSKTNGYFADISRTVCIGKPSPELQKMYETVLEAQELAISLVKPKAKCSSIQNAVLKLFSDRGYKTSGKGTEFKFAEGFVHSVGHGVGTKIHEPPKFGSKSPDILEVGDVITIEPALYYKNLGGIRLEDMLWVTKEGRENLTRFPKVFQI